MASVPDGARVPTDRLGKKPRRVVVGVYLDDSLAELHDHAVAALERARAGAEGERGRRIVEGKDRAGLDLTTPPEERQQIAAAVLDQVEQELAAELAPLQAAVDEALVALDAATVWFTFRSLGRKRWRALVKAHPPTEADHEAIRRDSGNDEAKAAWDAETLAPVLLGECCIGRLVDGEQLGPLTSEDLEAMFGGECWGDLEVQALFVSALNAQMQARAVTHRDAPAGALRVA